MRTGHGGLRLLDVARDRERLAPDEYEGAAKALGYADEVSNAVQSSGRRAGPGEVSVGGVNVRSPLAPPRVSTT